ncbi:MAG: sensor histidine kinase, partial [Pontiellaceae bacterium]|nr:sensor histidine kinase [Pontiellaceae bacterium]
LLTANKKPLGWYILIRPQVVHFNRPVRAIANAIDQGADTVSVKIYIESFDKPDTLRIVISDNGFGFTDENFSKFTKLLEVEQVDHKGLGRLVYLAYFDEIHVTSCFNGGRCRRFLFSGNFEGNSTVSDAEEFFPGAKLEFTKFSGAKIKSYDYLKPPCLKKELIRHFFPQLFERKHQGKELTIEIEVQTENPNKKYDFCSEKEVVTLDDIPELEKKGFESSELDWFQQFEVHYSITHEPATPTTIVTDICIDGRAIHYDLVSQEALPGGFKAIFLFRSEYFEGKTDSSRQKLKLPDGVSERSLKKVLRQEIAEIINEKIPELKQSNERKAEMLGTTFPHLSGYFESNVVGLMREDEVLEDAQKKFFADQKTILECTELNDSQYEKALDMSARALMEYILYRTRIIQKLKTMTPANSEGEIHDLIVPRKRILKADTFVLDIYNNNVWMLDDKYMSYSTVLSDEQMSKVIHEIALDDLEDEKRPDITIVFSGDPNTADKVDVVVVELKKHGLPLAKNEEVISQLRQRARKLLKYYPDKIERIWFYGITDIDEEFKVSLLEDEYKELFSHGNMYYKSQPIIVDDPKKPFPVDLYVLTYDTFINDAESRNSTFLKVLKSSIEKASKQGRLEV